MSNTAEEGSSNSSNSSSLGHYARPLSEEEVDRLKADGEVVSEFKQRKLELQARANWDKFYHRNETRFFKDRHWTRDEFQELCPDIDFKVTTFISWN